jgi:hypothetical protein
VFYTCVSRRKCPIKSLAAIPFRVNLIPKIVQFLGDVFMTSNLSKDQKTEKFCRFCGEKISFIAKFCNFCGGSLISPENKNTEESKDFESKEIDKSEAKDKLDELLQKAKEKYLGESDSSKIAIDEDNTSAQESTDRVDMTGVYPTKVTRSNETVSSLDIEVTGEGNAEEEEEEHEEENDDQ